MSTEQNETRDESTIPAGEDATYFGSPRSVNSGEMLEPPDSPLPDSPDSLFSDESFKPDLSGPEPGEEPQYRGRRSEAVAKAQPIVLAQPPMAVANEPAPRRGGANPTVAQAAPAYPVADVPPNPPQQD